MLLFCLSVEAGAKTISYMPYEGYEYNNHDVSVAAPAGYAVDKAYTSADMGLEVMLDTPTDMQYDGKYIYILDSGNAEYYS